MSSIWRPAASAIGLQPAYALHRIAGRYRVAAQERARLHAAYPLRAPSPFDLAELRTSPAGVTLRLATARD